MESKESYYLTKGGAKRPQPRLLPKLKGHLIESIAWNKTEQTEQSTGAILIGTNAGKYMYMYLFIRHVYTCTVLDIIKFTCYTCTFIDYSVHCECSPLY